jgi:pimeloyl-ACP methyl ester carboxylesterase
VVTETETEDATEPAAEPTKKAPAAAPEEVVIEAADGLPIVSTFYPGAGAGPWPTIILLHMNGGDRSDWASFAEQLAQNGYAAMTVDMRGHGDTGDSKDWDKTAEDLSLVWAHLAGREDVDAERIAAAGASIGANMSVVLAVNEPSLKTMILLSAGEDYFGVTTDDRIQEYGDRPVLFVASQEDTAAADSSRDLHELAKGTVELIMYNGAGHGTNMFNKQPELADMMLEWFDRYVMGESAAATDRQPAATVFGADWDDRSLFRSGLIDSEAAVLEQLPGATVYHMDLEIAPDLYSVSGRQQVRYTNQEDVALNEVFFHLFPNILGGRTNISGVTLNGEPVTPEYDSIRSVIGVPLASPLAPGEQVVIGMDFKVDVPSEGGSNYGVFATVDDVLALAHFYPQVAVYDDEGWNIDLPSENADPTYGDSSFYLVQVTAPADQVVVASGVEIDKQIDGDKQLLTIASGPSRDFYLASNDRYVVDSRTIGDTVINSYVFPEFADQNDQVLDIAEAAIKSMSDRLGPYPYTEFDIAPTPNLALGVEYPGMTVVRSALYDPEATLGETPAMFYLEGTVAHEVGHQWFYNAVGNDQIDEPWVDESLVQYMTMLYFLDVYGEQGEEGFRDSFLRRWDSIDGADIPIGLPAGEYEGSEYSGIIYGRGPLFFDALAEEMGEESFNTFLRDYYQANKWGIASGATIKAAAEETCGCDLTDIFAEWIGDL